MPDPRLARPAWRGRTNVDALTIACIEHAEAIGGHQFVVTQGSYQDGHGDLNSAGTHDLGGVVDLRWCGHPACIRALRQAGMFAWHRTPAQGPWVDHIHAGVLDHPLLAAGARAQQRAYLVGRNGLANNGPDDGPRLDPIPRPVWPYSPEDDVTPEDIEKVAAAVLAQPMKVRRPGAKDTTTLSVEQVLRETFQRAERIDEDAIAQRVVSALGPVGLDPEGVNADQIAAAVKQALREGTGD